MKFLLETGLVTEKPSQFWGC